MTNKERLISLCGFVPSNDTLNGALIDVAVSGQDEYNGSNIIPLKRAAIQVISLLLSTPNTDSQVPGHSVNYDRNAVYRRLKMLQDDVGEHSLKPTIKARRLW